MKKLLTVSLVAVMAVSAAHAKIASTNYVDNKVAPVATKVGSATFTKGAAAGKADVTVAIDAVAEAVAGLSGKGTDSVAGQIAAAKQELEGKVNSLANGAVKTNTEAIAALNDAENGVLAQAAADATSKANTAKSDANTFTTTEIQKLDVAQVGAEGSFIELVSEADGKVSATPKGFATEVTATGKIAPTAGAVATYVGDAIEVLTNNIGGQETRLGKVEEAIVDITNEEEGILAQAAADATSKANTAKSDANTFTTTEIQKLDVAQVGAEGSFIELVSEADGKVSATPKGFATEVAANGKIAPTAGAVYTAIEAAKNAGKTDIQSIDSTHAAETNKFVTGMTQVDGKITQVTKSSINDAVVALASVPTECGANGANKCALSVQKGTFTWEIIEN